VRACPAIGVEVEALVLAHPSDGLAALVGPRHHLLATEVVWHLYLSIFFKRGLEVMGLK